MLVRYSNPAAVATTGYFSVNSFSGYLSEICVYATYRCCYYCLQLQIVLWIQWCPALPKHRYFLISVMMLDACSVFILFAKISEASVLPQGYNITFDACTTWCYVQVGEDIAQTYLLHDGENYRVTVTVGGPVKLVSTSFFSNPSLGMEILTVRPECLVLAKMIDCLMICLWCCWIL